MTVCPHCKKEGTLFPHPTVQGRVPQIICMSCGYIGDAPVNMATGVDPVTAFLFKTMRPDLLTSLQDRIIQQTEQMTTNFKGLLQIADSIDTLSKSLDGVAKMDDTMKDLRNTMTETNTRLKELTDKL